MSFPQGAKEMLRWVRRSLMAIDTVWSESERDMSLLSRDVFGHVTIADIVLYQFLEFTKDCYGVDMTIGSGEIVRDVYGREVVEEFPKLREFYAAYKTRSSAIRHADKGEVASEIPLKNMQTWAEGVL
jgi:glutathione S-transferase